MFAAFQQDSGFSLDFGRGLTADLGNRLKWGALLVGLILLFVLLSFLRSIYTELLWFDEVGFRGVYLKVLVTRVLLFVGGALVFGIPLGVSLFFANRVSQGPEAIPLPESTRLLLKRLIRWGTVAAAVVLSLVFGTIVSSQWEVFLKFGNAVSFGILDPVYQRDASFYVFILPLYDLIQGWLLGVAIVILLATGGLYFVNFSFRGVDFVITPGVRVQVSIIAAIIMFILGLGHWLDRWELLLSEHGAVFGAAYTDINARKPALLVLTIIAVASGVLILVNGYMRGIRLLIGGVALWIVMAIVLGTLWPNAMQRLSVTPQEFAREMPYIENNIRFTRSAFGLHRISRESYPVEATVTDEMISDNLQTIDNIRLWDHGPLSSVYRFEQIIRPYYDFGEADVDRYIVDGKYRQVLLAAREMAAEQLDPQAQTWVNQRLRYTHGFGVAMSPVAEVTAAGRPLFFAKDIPADGTIAVQSDPPVGAAETVITNPRIYYGERTGEYVIVNTKTDELDYPTQESEPESIRYSGDGGVPISSFINRVAYAWQFGDVNILITGEITGESKIQYRREVQERVSTIAPFLRLDEDPYVVAAEGGLFWVQDAYTVSDRYPYSDPTPDGLEGGFNYIRNSVKVTVDAFNGTVRFYVWDPDDPVITTYNKIFPKLFEPKGNMPESLQTHVRYPLDLFGFQAAKYLKYHMENPQDFYNLEDIWSIPSEKVGQSSELQSVDPYYVIMKIPEEEREEFVLLLPYTRNKLNPIMAGWLAARNDEPNYGELVAFSFPKDEQVDGPEQVEARIDIDPTISEWFTLRCQEGSFCIRGNLLVIPLAGSLLYVEPVYLQAEGVDFPELRRVIVASGDKVVMEDTLDQALASLTGFARAASETPVDGQPPGPAEVTLPADAAQTDLDKLSDVVERLKATLSELEEALQSLEETAGGP